MKGKLLLATVLTAAIVFGLSACGQSSAASSASGVGASSDLTASQDPLAAEFRTMSDAFAVGGENASAEYDSDVFAFRFEHDGKQLRVVADMTNDVYAEIEDIEPDDVDRRAKIEELAGPLEVRQVEVLTEAASS